MKNSKIFSSAIAMLFCIIAFAQEKTITGIVSDKLGPLPGANVVVKGTTRGTQTDFDGKYSIKAKEGETLDFSYIGMKSKQVKIAKKTTINVQLDEDGVSLDEVVVVGYGTTKKEIYTGSVSNVQSNEVEYKGKSIKDVNAKPIQSIQNKLMGTTAGVSVSHNSNNIVIRGASSPTSNTNPLYIVDGIPVHGDDFKKLDPNSIATVNVLKDSSAASLYGSRASNGVVEIKTKNGLTKEQIETFKKNYTNPVDVLPVIDENEDYEAFVENDFESPKSSPLSTFSIDVDNASYTNI
ncbi:MAG TPA: von Willebrand factor type A domain-containing protein, partial [Flavobacterium sp.]|nr:von Willebrand factor type A domain-containing protein [Flavobacterium sp.]